MNPGTETPSQNINSHIRINAQNNADTSLPSTQRIAPTQRLSGVICPGSWKWVISNICRSGVYSTIDDGYLNPTKSKVRSNGYSSTSLPDSYIQEAHRFAAILTPDAILQNIQRQKEGHSRTKLE
jgi:hypothetical protein